MSHSSTFGICQNPCKNHMKEKMLYRFIESACGFTLSPTTHVSPSHLNSESPEVTRPVSGGHPHSAGCGGRLNGFLRVCEMQTSPRPASVGLRKAGPGAQLDRGSGWAGSVLILLPSLAFDENLNPDAEQTIDTAFMSMQI